MTNILIALITGIVIFLVSTFTSAKTGLGKPDYRTGFIFGGVVAVVLFLALTFMK